MPENEAFWSITFYGDDGYMKSDNNILNSSTAKIMPWVAPLTASVHRAALLQRE